ncbi:hypothetical protein PR003_g20186 [Phytophthora rubi]|nr:hypothetical protein PF003_g40702 [Phytophthora fragariae]KAE9025177.1 hypothetical protein PF011_g3148 [Phytophthora fragariae]KAE9310760.1 hypothetical protein PR003_g20186 [Phytophthora rubi]KAE9341296.1 hypothetical protein PF008_g10697 [Phytophthora fragariae]
MSIAQGIRQSPCILLVLLSGSMDNFACASFFNTFNNTQNSLPAKYPSISATSSMDSTDFTNDAG